MSTSVFTCFFLRQKYINVVRLERNAKTTLNFPRVGGGGGGAGGGGGTLYNALYWEAPPERVSFSGLRYMQG